MKEHHYLAKVEWAGNQGSGTSSYTSYKRDHIISIAGKPDIFGSADPAFRGDLSKYNPEDLLVASLSACHMLWYLHLCAINKIIVTSYIDHPNGSMTEEEDGSGHFTNVMLYPEVTVTETSMVKKAEELHEEAHKKCFISRSVNFPVHHRAVINVLSNHKV